jgi:hypothetical protein
MNIENKSFTLRRQIDRCLTRRMNPERNTKAGESKTRGKAAVIGKKRTNKMAKKKFVLAS